MVNFFSILQNPQFKHIKFFEVMRDFRKGGLNPSIYDEFIQEVNQLSNIISRKPNDYHAFEKFNLYDIGQSDFETIMREIARRGIENNKKCWHPEASSSTCKVNHNGKIIVSAAHSIQNNGILSKVAEDGHVMSFALDKAEVNGASFGKNYASIFWGFCNFHDAIFSPIEVVPYNGTDEQHFLYAYRGFVIASHKKIEVSDWMNFGNQYLNDIEGNRRIFDESIMSKDYSTIQTEVFELPAFYPVAVASSFYLDYDFEGNPILHSDTRMEKIYVNLFPMNNKTLFLLSFFSEDTHLYKDLGNQLRTRNNLKSDITMLLAAHTENIYFNPTYYKTFIEKHESDLKTIMFEAQMDYGYVDEENKIYSSVSFTPNNYLNNPYEVNFFGY